MRFSSEMKYCLLLASLALTTDSVAQELSVSQPDVVASLQESKAADRLADFARLTWAVLETIDREHIQPPKRVMLLQAVAACLIEPKPGELRGVVNPRVRAMRPQRPRVAERRGLEPITARLHECQDVDSFALVFRDVWAEFQKNKTPGDEFINELVEHLSETDGLQSLVSAKEEAVNEQFRNNRYIGLGVTLNGSREGSLVFASIVPGGPADRAGLKAGTEVIEIEGHSTKNLDVGKAIDRIRGPAGTEVMLTIRDPGSPESRRIGIKRGLVRFDTLYDRQEKPISRIPMLERVQSQPIGWIKFREISSSTVSELRDADAKARTQGMLVMIFDFRSFSRGPNLHQAKLVADSLIDGGILWSSQTRHGDIEVETADRESLFRNIPLVILLPGNGSNGFVDPASCAIAAALQDAGRATIVGSPTQFDGQVGTVIPVPGFPYSMYLNTHRLVRAKAGVGWPLVDNHSVAEPQQQEFQPQQLVLQRQRTGQDPVSALAPANTASFWRSLIGSVNSNERGQFVPGNQKEPSREVQLGPPVTERQLRKIREELLEAAAIRVATEILNSLTKVHP